MPNFKFRRELDVDGTRVTVKNQRFHILEQCDEKKLSGKYLLGYKKGKLVYKQTYSTPNEWAWLDKTIKRMERNK